MVETAVTAHTREAISYQHITGSEKSTLRTAMRAEVKAVQFYRDFEEATTDANGKKTFTSLVKQEEGHVKVIKLAMDTYSATQDVPFTAKVLLVLLGCLSTE